MNRRELLKLAAVAPMSSSFKAQEPVTSKTHGSELMAKLSAYMADAGNRKLPEEVVERTKQIVLDTVTAMISGAELPPGQFAIRFAHAYKGEKVATVAASNVLIGPIEAAMVNGMLAHSDETDDSHSFSQSHPGSSVVPSSLAVGEQFAIDGNRFLRAVALGYDIGPRVTITLGGVPYMTETHRSTHALSGTFGSAAAAGCAANLTAQQMRWLLSYTGQQASGLASWQRDTGHIEKSFDFAGMAARNGVTSALLVQAGGTGVDDVFSGTDNFFQAFMPKNDPSYMVEKLGERYEVTRTSFKKWTVGSPIQAVLDALEIILKRESVDPERIKQVQVRVATNEAKVVDNREIPDICLQHLTAVMLIDKNLTFKSAHDKARMQDPAVLKLRAKVQLIPDEELERRLPQREGTVDLLMDDGKKISEHVAAVRGTFNNPMSREEVITKGRELMTPVLGAGQTAKLIEAIMALENLKNIRDLRPLLQRA